MKTRVHLTLLIVFLLFISSCAKQDQPPRVEEITFQSGSFNVVGDLRTPAGSAPFPVVLFVHGSDSVNRLGGGGYLPIMERMLEAGYATFAWDKPGTGESIGTIDPFHLIQQRAQILLDAIKVMKERSDIDSSQIGLWGISQAGYVMPYALAQSQDIAFMICISCPGMPGEDQMAFQLTAFALCDGVPEEKTDQESLLLADLDEARTYDTYEEYLHYREVLETLAGLVNVPVESRSVLSEKSWQENPPVNRATWNPVVGLEQVKIPILAIFGASDRQIDPLQGAHAYRKALEQTGNPLSRVELFPDANHGIAPSKTGCPEEDRQFLEQYVKTLGYASLSEAQAAMPKDPYQAGLLGDPFVPGYLDLQEEWLRNLQDSR